jgi:hypothetical protein
MTRTYDAGREVWKPRPRPTEMAEDGIVRLAHEAAWRLAQQAVLDLRQWLEAQRDGNSPAETAEVTGPAGAQSATAAR